MLVKRDPDILADRFRLRVQMLCLWASYQIGKTVGANAPGMPGTFSPPQWVSDPDMNHGTCVTHVPWCKPGSLTSGFLWSRRQFPAFPAHAQPAILRIWQDAHSQAYLLGRLGNSRLRVNPDKIKYGLVNPPPPHTKNKEKQTHNTCYFH